MLTNSYIPVYKTNQNIYQGESIVGPKTHLSISATGNDLVFLWVVAHRPQECVGYHHLKTHKSPTGGDAENPEDGIKETRKGEFYRCSNGLEKLYVLEVLSLHELPIAVYCF